MRNCDFNSTGTLTHLVPAASVHDGLVQRQMGAPDLHCLGLPGLATPGWGGGGHADLRGRSLPGARSPSGPAHSRQVCQLHVLVPGQPLHLCCRCSCGQRCMLVGGGPLSLRDEGWVQGCLRSPPCQHTHTKTHTCMQLPPPGAQGQGQLPGSCPSALCLPRALQRLGTLLGWPAGTPCAG